jgi:hypothetical protein
MAQSQYVEKLAQAVKAQASYMKKVQQTAEEAKKTSEKA